MPTFPDLSILSILAASAENADPYRVAIIAAAIAKIEEHLVASTRIHLAELSKSIELAVLELHRLSLDPQARKECDEHITKLDAMRKNFGEYEEHVARLDATYTLTMEKGQILLSAAARCAQKQGRVLQTELDRSLEAYLREPLMVPSRAADFKLDKSVAKTTCPTTYPKTTTKVAGCRRPTRKLGRKTVVH
jgi:hypothetical protein